MILAKVLVNKLFSGCECPHIGKAKASTLPERFIPNPKLKLLEQVSEVMRFKHYSTRTETTYREWTKRFIFVDGKRHPPRDGSFGSGEMFL